MDYSRTSDGFRNILETASLSQTAPPNWDGVGVTKNPEYFRMTDYDDMPVAVWDDFTIVLDQLAPMIKGKGYVARGITGESWILRVGDNTIQFWMQDIGSFKHWRMQAHGYAVEDKTIVPITPRKARRWVTLMLSSQKLSNA